MNIVNILALSFMKDISGIASCQTDALLPFKNPTNAPVCHTHCSVSNSFVCF